MIPASIYMISGSLDSQKSDDIFDVNEFELPFASGLSGGACTTALLKILYNSSNDKEVTWLWLLKKLRLELKRLGYDQIPQLSSSRKINTEVFKQNGVKRALLIGINYTGQRGELFGCQNDIRNMKRYLKEVQHYNETNMIILMDDGQSTKPTRANIEKAFTQIVNISKSGDVVWIHYAGHGERVKDKSKDERSGVDSTLIPLDFRLAGVIVDDDIHKLLVEPMSSNVHVSVITDCCHSGTILDLPYILK